MHFTSLGFVQISRPEKGLSFIPALKVFFRVKLLDYQQKKCFRDTYVQFRMISPVSLCTQYRMRYRKDVPCQLLCPVCKNEIELLCPVCKMKSRTSHRCYSDAMDINALKGGEHNSKYLYYQSSFSSYGCRRRGVHYSAFTLSVQSLPRAESSCIK